MKVAIPTNDGLTISPEFSQAQGFLVLTMELGRITSEELRWNGPADAIEIPRTLADCDTVLARHITPATTRLMAESHKEVELTSDPIITNACIHYMEHTLRHASDTCCCP